MTDEGAAVGDMSCCGVSPTCTCICHEPKGGGDDPKSWWHVFRDAAIRAVDEARLREWNYDLIAAAEIERLRAQLARLADTEGLAQIICDSDPTGPEINWSRRYERERGYFRDLARAVQAWVRGQPPTGASR